MKNDPLRQWLGMNRGRIVMILGTLFLIEIALYWGIVLGYTHGNPGRYRPVEIAAFLKEVFDSF